MSDQERLARIEERLTALETAALNTAALGTAGLGAAAPEGAGPPPAEAGQRERFWALEGLAEDAAALPGGAVVYAGRVTLPTGAEYAWQRTHGAEEARSAGPESDDALVAALSALAHPVRLRLVREVLAGHATTAELAALPGLGTTGQLHHHLRQLTAAGWLRTTARGTYGVPGDRVVPLHVVLAAVAS